MKRSGSMWPVFLVGLLASNVAIVGITVYFAKSDPGFSVEPQYYQKAVHFEDRQREIEQNRALGWTASIRPKPGTAGSCEVRLELADRTGRPIAGAKAHGVGFHNARAADVVAITFVPREHGLSAVLENVKPGLWTFQVIVEGPQGEAFTAELEAPVDTLEASTR